ncbi:hypothetical protein ZIOFF_005867 [Zingiber officinale]|uniref:2Fe-2S ferredoxin-type domain-containing protein n=1 Tax=Zingiber officinale TaxID=94328 RepID=A0A8J5HWJ9_ZINOF|nr:hypothetical protein ZIOFF_005867 [Zingiber officinale]
MATALLHFSAASAASTPLYTTSIFPRGLPSSAARVHCPPPFVRRRGRASMMAKAYKEGLAVPHDCKLGVCMTCPARLVSGTVDQSDGMLSDDVIEKGYALLCASYPRSDCHISTIPEEELLSLQLATAND